MAKKLLNYRDSSIDRFKGLILFCMIFFICAGDFDSFGVLSQVANNYNGKTLTIVDGITFADLLTPTFIFLISLTYQLSFNKRYEKNKSGAYLHFIIRYGIFLGIGSIIVSGENVFIKKIEDTFFFITILMYASLIMSFINLVLLIFKGKKGKIQTVRKIAKYILVALLLIQAVVSLVMGVRDIYIAFFVDIDKKYNFWSILHLIGATGLISLLYVRMNIKFKVLTFYGILFLYSFLQTIPNIVNCFDAVVLGGLIGAIGWSLVMLGGMIIVNLVSSKNYFFFFLFTLSLLPITIMTMLLIEPRSEAVTANYLLLALLINSFVFVIISLFRNVKLRFDPFMWWGRNPILIYILGLAIRGIEKAINPPRDLSAFIVYPILFVIIAVITLISYILYKKNKLIKI